MAPSRHDWKIVDWDVKPQHNQPTTQKSPPLKQIFGSTSGCTSLLQVIINISKGCTSLLQAIIYLKIYNIQKYIALATELILVWLDGTVHRSFTMVRDRVRRFLSK